jgi:hypothetical protein
MATRIQKRRDTAANWTAVNPVLAQGEEGIELDTNKEKIGNGTTAWNSLPYKTLGLTPSAIGAATAAQGAKADSAVQPAGLTKAAVGLGNVDNTSDANKPVSTAQAAALAVKADTTSVVAAVAAHEAAADPHPGYLTAAEGNAAYATAAQGTKADTAIQPGNPALSDPRTPTAHKSSHSAGGNDALSPADIGAVSTSDSRLSDSREWSADTISQAEAETGIATTRRAFTALRVFQAIASWWNGSAAKTKLDGIQDGAQANVSTNLSYDAATRTLASSTGSPAVLPLFGSSAAGLVPAGGGGTTKYLREDGAFEEPPGAGGFPGGSNTQIQFNDGGTFGGDIDLTYNKTTNLLTSKGDILLDDGGSFTTTLQTVTATANRTISFPDATGTVALVGGSSGQVLVNTNGAVAGLSTLTADASGNLTLTARLINAFNAAASAPAKLFSGTWFTGGTSTTTKPHVLIEPAGTSSTHWNTGGTGWGVNGPPGFAGDLAWLGVNGTSFFRLSSGSGLSINGTVAGNTFRDGGGAFQLDGNGLRIRSDRVFGIGTDAFGTNADVLWRRDGAGIWATYNGANPQTVRIYNTFTSATNFERAKLEWSSNILRLGTEKGTAGGTARDMEFQTDGVTRITLKADGAILFSNIPTTNPNVAGQLWSDANDGGTLKLSAG